MGFSPIRAHQLFEILHGYSYLQFYSAFQKNLLTTAWIILGFRIWCSSLRRHFPRMEACLFCTSVFLSLIHSPFFTFSSYWRLYFAWLSYGLCLTPLDNPFEHEWSSIVFALIHILRFLWSFLCIWFAYSSKDDKVISILCVVIAALSVLISFAVYSQQAANFS